MRGVATFCAALSLDAVVMVAILFWLICLSLSKHGDGVQALYYTIPFFPFIHFPDLRLSLILSLVRAPRPLDHLLSFFFDRSSTIDGLLHHAQEQSRHIIYASVL